MRYEIVRDTKIPKVGFGTWSIGGKNTADPSLDAQSLAILRSALDLGYTHFDTAEMYAMGHCEELVGQAVRDSGIDRSTLFITTKIWFNHLSYKDTLQSCAASLKRLNMEYVDLYLIHWPSVGMDLTETFKALNLLVKEGKVRHLGVSNFNLKQLQQAAALSESPLLTDQVPYSIPDQKYLKNGVLEYCQQHDILVTAYTPVKHRYTAGNRELKTAAEARGISAHQLSIAWLTSQPRVITIPMSSSPLHQRQNLEAADIVLSSEEIERLRRKY